MPPVHFHPISRRAFIGGTALALTALPARSQPKKSLWPIIGFIKPFQKMPVDQLAALVHELGWDGVEVPVRTGGTIEPGEAETELPRYAEALRKAGVEVTILATDVADASDPIARRVLKTARALGIRRYRVKHLTYDLARPIAPQVAEIGAKLRELAALNKELDLQGSVQNHSGATYVGAPVWDLWQMLRETDPRYLGIYFDIAHATIEGGLSWPLEAKLAEPLLAAVFVKDFSWTRSNSAKAKWEAVWRPLGEGMVNGGFFQSLKATKFAGPISMHFEYELGEGEPLRAALKRDTQTLRDWLG